jgi:two-component system CheB/CheR fusion protein
MAKLKQDFPVVGIGASAGGLAAFEAFFSGMPARSDPGMAFVLVQHLAPDHKSILTALIQRYTRMKVFEVEDGMVVKPNCAYIIPPNRDMAFLKGALHLLEPSAPRGQRLPIDFFFRSLAQDQGDRAICIILSGTGSDGTLGLRAIKGEGGMVMVQNPSSTEYDGMPRSALNTGLVDYELPPAEMPAQLIAYISHAFSKLPHDEDDSLPKTENALKKIFILLRAQTNHDFSLYKPSTINRRIERRMAVQHIKTINDYVRFLQQTPAEVDALFRDLLIGVTNFFRDPEAFRFMEEQVIPKLLAGKPAGGVIRVWSPGCSTGEEPYSIAIMLSERQDAMKKSYKVQVFATDIDSQAIALARAGVYPASIAADISPERLARFFTVEQDGSAYRINKSIRDMLVFSEQDVIKDPPFSKLDLISCRNLLIYMGAELQKSLIPLFHYSLNPDGILMLGTSETIGEFSTLFTPVDRVLKIYRRMVDFARGKSTSPTRFIAISTANEPGLTLPAIKRPTPGKLSLRDITEQALLLQAIPAAVLVNSLGDILYVHGRTGMFLEPAPGESGVNNILKMAREGLKRELTTSLHKAVALSKVVERKGLRVKTNGSYSNVDLVIRPVINTSPGHTELPLFLVQLNESCISDIPALNKAGDNITPSLEADINIAALRQELRAKEEYLQSANEELETSNEELKSSNEEMQSVNEELQSTNEELETSKEELQSVNEELSTVNAELQTKVIDLSRVNNDMNNLLAGTGIATIFVDHSLHILRFTPAITRIINLIMSDVGRPLGHIVSNLIGYHNLVADVKTVLDTLIPKETEVQINESKWYLMRIHPYRTLENVIEGAVITFTDISDAVRMREELLKSDSLLRLAVIVRDAHDAITLHDLDGKILAWNPGAARMYGWSESEALAMNIRDLIPEDLRETEVLRTYRLSQAEVLEPIFTKRLTKKGDVMNVWITATALVNEAGQIYAIATTERKK